MSVINKYPFINELLSDLSSDELTTLNHCINGQGDAPIFRTLKSWGSSVLSSEDKGVYPINLEMNGPSALTYQGYLIYNDDWCVLIAYPNEDACQLTIINITMPESGSDIKWSYIPEKLTINELRSEMFDVANGSGGGEGDDAQMYSLSCQVTIDDTTIYLSGNFTFKSIKYILIWYGYTGNLDSYEDINDYFNDNPSQTIVDAVGTFLLSHATYVYDFDYDGTCYLLYNEDEPDSKKIIYCNGTGTITTLSDSTVSYSNVSINETL